MDIKKEGMIIAALILIIYALSIPLTAHITNEYTYDGMTVTYKKVKALNNYGVTEVYTLALKGPVTYRGPENYITINGTPIRLTEYVRGGTIYYAAAIKEKPTKININTITFKPYTPLTSKVPIIYLALTIITIIGVTRISTLTGKELIRKRRLFITGMILLAFAALSAASLHPYYSYNFGKFSFTATTGIHVIDTSTIETYTPFTAKILPLGTTATLAITAPGGTTYNAYYYESIGYVFTAKSAYPSIWINNTTAKLQVKHTYVWQLAAAYTITFVIFFVAVLFVYSYFIFDLLGYEEK